MLANLSASNITVGKWEYRQELVRGSSAQNLAVQLYSAAGFGESTADLAWDGHGHHRRPRRAASPRPSASSLGGTHAVVDVDLQALAQDRMRQTSFGAERARCTRGRCASSTASREPTPRAARHLGALRAPHRPAPVRAAPIRRERDVRCREVFLIQATALARRLHSLPPESRRIVIGVSGGRDSTHALLVAVHAIDLLGLAADATCSAVTMPGLRHHRPHLRRNA